MATTPTKHKFMNTNNNHDWYECRIKYRKEMDDGSVKKITETYLVLAECVSKAEKRLLQDMASMIEGDSVVTSVKEAKFKELFRNDEEKFFQCKISFVSFDEETGAEKKSNQVILVQADDIGSALKNLKAGMKGSMSDFEILSIGVTSIIEIIS